MADGFEAPRHDHTKALQARIPGRGIGA